VLQSYEEVITRTYTTIDSPLGPLTLVNTDGVLSELSWDRHSNGPGQSRKTADGFAQAVEQLSEYFAGERTEFSLPLAPDGHGFERRVWQVLMRIPYGTTWSYAQVAEEIGDRSLARAVGVANGHNPISIVVPCHRVIGADGSLTGYGGGLARKEFLLALENPSRARNLPLF
jgi:methylated-DNA-[protein]-cysteine S-methyltransferase